MKLFFKMSSLRNWIICCFFNFIVASIVGLLMRFSYLFPFKGINYIYLLHAHSHVAMLGWVYMMIYVLIVQFFIPKEKSAKPIYNHLFWITECTIIGMMISFPIQGYALFSIVFSTLHILLSYVFCWLVWRDFSKDKSAAEKLLIASILFMILSTFGVWFLGPTIKILGKQNVFYQAAIQFFLHFQFNGWFLFTVLALFIKQFKNKIEATKVKIFLILLVLGTVFTVAFPISWYLKSSILNWVTVLGVFSQLIAFFYFYKMLQPQIHEFRANLNSITKKAYRFALCSVCLKVIIQLIVVLPNLADVSHQIRSWVIGFIHLTTLGIITGFLFGVLLQHNFLPRKVQVLKIGVHYFFCGYVLTELLLFLQGLMYYLGKGLLHGYYEIIFGASVFIVAGLFLILISILKNKNKV